MPDQAQPRREEMEILAAEIRICRKCPLWKDTHNGVPGEGDIDAALMLIGEAPGEREDLTGRPFVGRAGALLNRLLAGIGLTREEVFIANIVRHRPPENRDPRPVEIEICYPYLERQIQLIEPDIIMTLGRHAARTILASVPLPCEKITEIRGRVIPAELFSHPVRIIPTLHPASVLYNPAYRAALEEDFQTVQRELARPPV
jgi:uracil-DNA glycosylase